MFRDDLGYPAEVADLEALSGKKRRVRLDAIRTACQSHVAGPLKAQLAHLAATVIAAGHHRLELDADDKDGQTLLFWYPAVTGADGGYIRSAVKIEAGAKSALDPHVAATVTPYVAQDLPDLDLAVTNVVTVQPSLFCLLLLWDGRVDVDRQCRMLRGIRRVYMPTAIIGAIFFFRFWTWFDVVRHF